MRLPASFFLGHSSIILSYLSDYPNRDDCFSEEFEPKSITPSTASDFSLITNKRTRISIQRATPERRDKVVDILGIEEPRLSALGLCRSEKDRLLRHNSELH
jgi:hypothetical protein